MHVFNVVAVALALNCHLVHAGLFSRDNFPEEIHYGMRVFTSPQGANVSFQQPGKAGICETTKGVEDYSGYVTLDNKTHMFFWYVSSYDPKLVPLLLLDLTIVKVFCCSR